MVKDFYRMCDHCFKQVMEEEELYGFAIVDDNDNMKILQGHIECVNKMRTMLKEEGYLEEDESSGESNTE